MIPNPAYRPAEEVLKSRDKPLSTEDVDAAPVHMSTQSILETFGIETGSKSIDTDRQLAEFLESGKYGADILSELYRRFEVGRERLKDDKDDKSDPEPREWATLDELTKALKAIGIRFLRHSYSYGVRACTLIHEDGRATNLLYIVDSNNKDGYVMYTQLLKQKPKCHCVIDSGIDAQEDAAYLEGMLKE